MRRADGTGINDGSVPLISVVKGLGEYLTSTEDDTRLKGEIGLYFDPRLVADVPGLTFLTNVITSIKQTKINRQTSELAGNYGDVYMTDF